MPYLYAYMNILAYETQILRDGHLQIGWLCGGDVAGI